MVSVAVVEDDEVQRATLAGYVEEAGRRLGASLDCACFASGEEFLAAFHGDFDVLFLDIRLVGIDGMAVAEEVRARGSDAVIVFITHLASYAIRGYSVGALDYILKPVPFDAFLPKMRSALTKVTAKRSRSGYVRLNGATAVAVDEIAYIDIAGRKANIHMISGEVFKCRTPISELERKLPADAFFRCHVSIIVNARYVRKFHGSSVLLRDVELPVARSKKAEFSAFMTSYWGDQL